MEQQLLMRSATNGRFGGRFLATVVAGAALSACSAGSTGSQGGDPPVIGEPPVITSYSGIELPLGAYRPNQDQGISISRATDVIVTKCMARFGFRYTAPQRERYVEYDRFIGLVDEGDASSHGYRNRTGEAEAEKGRRAGAKEDALSPEMQGVMSGVGRSEVNGIDVPEGGCEGEARRVLLRSPSGEPGDENFVLRMSTEASRRAESDDRLLQAFSAWSACMARAGYHYVNPWAANNDPRFTGDVPSADEIATAKADVACRKRDNLNGLWVALLRAHQDGLIKESESLLGQHREKLGKTLDKANEVLASG